MLAVRRHRHAHPARSPGQAVAGRAHQCSRSADRLAGGVQLALGSARQRAVLGLLALHADSVVHRDSIVDMLWGERPPASAVAKVQAYMSRLRTVLGAGPARAQSANLVTTAGGRCYRLKLGTGRLDLAVFGALILEARGAVTRRETGCACDRYEQALELWRGDILADVDLLREHPSAIEATRRLAETVVAYAEAAADAGTNSRALPHLRDLCAREPLNEQAHALLMTALATTGQQAAALRLFAELQRRLDTELGISPSPVLTQAHTQVLRQNLNPPRG